MNRNDYDFLLLYVPSKPSNYVRLCKVFEVRVHQLPLPVNYASELNSTIVAFSIFFYIMSLISEGLVNDGLY